MMTSKLDYFPWIPKSGFDLVLVHYSVMTACYNFGLLNLFSEFEIMINPQVKREEDGKKSLKSIKKFLPQLSSMAKKEGLSVKTEKPKGPIKVDTIISAFKDEKVPIKL